MNKMTIRQKLESIKPLIRARNLEIAAVYEIIYFLYKEIPDYTTLILQMENFILTQESTFDALLKRYLDGEPIQYILGQATFLGQQFVVDKNVLIPRMETEEVVLKALELIQNRYDPKQQESLVIADVGSGSGIIGISLYLQLKDSFDVTIVFFDIDPAALEVSRINAAKHQLVKAEFICSDVFQNYSSSERKFDLIISNPPYIENPETIDLSVSQYEPARALLANPAEKYYLKIITQGLPLLKNDGLFVFEIAPGIDKRVCGLIKTWTLVQPEVFTDISGKTRIMCMAHGYTIKQVARALNRDQIAILPSDTIYGLATICSSINFSNLCQLKQRGLNRPFSVLFASVKEAEKYCKIDEKSRAFLNQILPGPISVILPARPQAPAYMQNQDQTIGIRVSPHPQLNSLFPLIDYSPLFFTSANFEGEPVLSEIADIYDQFPGIPYLSDDMVSSNNKGVPSTIVRISDRLELIRAGATPFADLLKIWEEV